MSISLTPSYFNVMILRQRDALVNHKHTMEFKLI